MVCSTSWIGYCISDFIAFPDATTAECMNAHNIGVGLKDKCA
jgi:hypothetical protein